MEYRSARFTFRHPAAAELPVRKRISEIAAMPVEAPDARKRAPMRRASLQNGSAELERSTPV
jgi:hypothetical protein